jgi:hypothetical protein
VKNMLEGAKRRLSVPIKKKDPITPDQYYVPILFYEKLD